MDPLTIGALLGIGYGVLEHGEQKRSAAKNRELQATIAAQSPWTKMQPNLAGTQDPSMLSIGKRGLEGAVMADSPLGAKAFDAASSALAGGEAQYPGGGNLVMQDSQNTGTVGPNFQPGSESSIMYGTGVAPSRPLHGQGPLQPRSDVLPVHYAQRQRYQIPGGAWTYMKPGQ